MQVSQNPAGERRGFHFFRFRVIQGTEAADDDGDDEEEDVCQCVRSPPSVTTHRHLSRHQLAM